MGLRKDNGGTTRGTPGASSGVSPLKRQMAFATADPEQPAQSPCFAAMLAASAS